MEHCKGGGPFVTKYKHLTPFNLFYLPPEQHRGRGNVSCGQSLMLCFHHSFMVTPFPCPVCIWNCSSHAQGILLLLLASSTWGHIQPALHGKIISVGAVGDRA